jgi:caffeoyl-CoA O-methyltransferase
MTKTGSALQFWDRLLPNQSEFSHHFNGGADALPRALFESIAETSALRAPSDEFTLEVSDRFSIEEMGSNPVLLRFLEFLVTISGAKTVLEVGTFIGVSAMCLARGLPEDGQVVTFERYDHFADIARRNFAANGLADRITLIEDDALVAIDTLPDDRTFDVIFIDGNKERYRDYFERLEPRLGPGGLIIVDDCFFHGDALNDAPETEKGRGVRDFLRLAASRDDFLRILLPISNGVMLMTRRQAPS